MSKEYKQLEASIINKFGREVTKELFAYEWEAKKGYEFGSKEYEVVSKAYNDLLSIVLKKISNKTLKERLAYLKTTGHFTDEPVVYLTRRVKRKK